MKKLKILSLVLFFVAITLILWGNGLSFALDVEASIEDRDEIIAKIKEEYAAYDLKFSGFSDKVLLFNRSIASYYGELENTHVNTVQVLEDIELLAESLKTSHDLIVDNCNKLPNDDYEYSGLCNTVGSKYNTVFLSYVEMIEGYNTLLTEYNVWVLEQGKEELELYTSKLYNEYIELNNK